MFGGCFLSHHFSLYVSVSQSVFVSLPRPFSCSFTPSLSLPPSPSSLLILSLSPSPSLPSVAFSIPSSLSHPLPPSSYLYISLSLTPSPPLSHPLSIFGKKGKKRKKWKKSTLVLRHFRPFLSTSSWAGEGALKRQDICARTALRSESLLGRWSYRLCSLRWYLLIFSLSSRTV